MPLFINTKTKDTCYERNDRYIYDSWICVDAFLVYQRYEQKPNRQTQRQIKMIQHNTIPLLVEILFEELPAVPLLKELPNIKTKWREILDLYTLQSDFEFYYTPTRLVFYHKNAPLSQPDNTQEFVGAPISIAYKDGNPTPACVGFARKCGVDIQDISTKNINGTDVLYYQKHTTGKKTTILLENMINEFLIKLNFGKSMRWGEGKYSFIRPVRGVVAMSGEQNIDISIYGTSSTKSTYIHRSISNEKKQFDTIQGYFEVLKNGGVILDQNKRKSTIIKQIRDISLSQNIAIDIDPQLLDEIVAITQYPTALLGQFDKEFLSLPQEVIINSMKEHQRYFACFIDGKITNKFIVVSNSLAGDFELILKGNEKVLRPRLADAMFFYDNDIKDGLDSSRLKDIKFADGLGSIYDKAVRETKIAQQFNESRELQEAIMISKADLPSDMVGEFPKLQGVMGYYYAQKLGYDDKICQAIRDQYKPTSEKGELPCTMFGAIVSISYRFDTILGMFSIDQIPTGSKDPYGLRRAVVAIVRICLKFDIRFDIVKLIDILRANYAKIDQDKLLEFFYGRYHKLYKDINPSVVKAVLAGQSSDIVAIDQRLKAMDTIVKQKEFQTNFQTFKRVANIVDDKTNSITVDENMLIEPQEKILATHIQNISKKTYDNIEAKLIELFDLKQDIDEFFDTVKINCDDIKLRQNRQNILYSIYKEFKKIADIKEITV